MTKDIVSLALGHRIPAPSSHWFLLFARLLLAHNVLDFLNDWTIEGPPLWLYAKSTNWRQSVETHVCVCVCANTHSHPVLFPVPSASWHPFRRFTSSAHLFAFSFLTELLLSSIILWGDRRGSFFLSLFDTRSACSCIPLAASFCLKWTLHTVTGLTIHCWAHSLHTEVRLPSRAHAHTQSSTDTSTGMDEHVQRRGNAYTSRRHRQHLTWVMLICYDSNKKSQQGERKQNNAAPP